MIVVTTVNHMTVDATRRLVRAVHGLHSGATVVVALLDDDPSLAAGSGADAVVARTELFPSTVEHDRAVGRCTAPQLAAVALPLVAAVVAEHRHRPVVAAAPAIEVADRLDTLLPDAGADARLVVVPRADAVLPPDDRHPDEADLTERGRFLTTLFAAVPAAAPTLRWWADATTRVPDRAGPLLESAVVAVGAHVCRDPRHGINGARTSTPGTAAPATVDTSGRSARSPHLFSAADGANPRLLLSDHANLASILTDRDTEVGDPEPTSDRFAERCRLIYAEAMRVHELTGTPEPPSPVDETAFHTWLTEPARRADGLDNLCHWLWATRSDLREAFPDPDLGAASRKRFLDWVRREAPHQEGIPPHLIPTAHAPETTHRSARRLPRRRRRPGANVAGFVDADLGVGEVGRLVIRGLEHAGIDVTVQTVLGTANRRRTRLAPADDPPVHGTDIVCLNADRIGAYLDARGDGAERRHTAGVFFWETDVLTPRMLEGLSRVDAVWAGSSYVADQFRPAATVPVEVLPVPVLPPTPVGDGRSLLGVDPDRPVFFFTFDHHSSARRKNVDGLIRAFRDAFPRDEGPVLVCKSINGDRLPAECERLFAAAGGRPDIRLSDGYVEAGELSAMIAAADAYVSLHRSEGRWLEPDHEAAVAALRTIVADPTDAAERADRARTSIVETHGLDRTARFLEEHVR